MVFLFGACQLLHFLSPAAQNQLLEFADTYTLEQIGQTISNLYGSETYSIDVDAMGVLHVLVQQNGYEANLYSYKMSALNWELKSTNSIPNTMYFPVLDFHGTSPYAAYMPNGNPPVVYDCSTLPGTGFGPAMFYYPNAMDFIVTSTGKKIIAVSSNEGSVISNYIRVMEYNGATWQSYTGFNSLIFSNYITSIDLQESPNGQIFVLVNSDGMNRLFVTAGTAWSGTYIFEMSSKFISYALDGAGNIYYIYHNQLVTNVVYYDIRNTGAPAISAHYTKKFIDGAVYNSEKTCAATKNTPYYFYTFAGVLGSSETNISIMRISPDGQFKEIFKVSSFMGDMPGLKMACAPDGTLYFGYAQNTNAMNFLTVYKLD